MDSDPTSLTLEELLSHTGWIRGLARRLITDPGAVDDVVQQTVVKALETRPRSRESLPAWLSAVVRNFARQRIRGEARRAHSEARAPGIEGKGTPSPDELVTRLETQRILAEEVARLEEPYRSTVLLHFYEGLSLAEIARRLETPAGTLRWRMKRALDDLRDRMDRRHGGDRRAWCLPLLPILDLEPQAIASAMKIGGGATVEAVRSLPLILKVVAAVTAIVGATAILFPLLRGDEGTRLPEGEELVANTTVAVVQEPVDEDEEEVKLESATVDAPAEKEPPEASGESASTAPGLASLLQGIADAMPKTQRATVHARALDEEGEPLAGVEVELVGYDAVRFRGPLEVELTGATGETGPDGTVRLDLAVPGAALLLVPTSMRPTPGEAVDLLFEFRSPRHRSRAEKVTVADGQTGNLGDVILSPGGGVIGSVADDAGRPVADARIQVAAPLAGDGSLDLGQKGSGPSRAKRRTDFQTKTAADGSFRLGGLPEGRSSIWANVPGRPWVACNVEVIPGEEASVALVLDDDPTVPRDLVVWARTPGGDPLPEAFVHVRTRYTERQGVSTSSGRADREGRRHVPIHLIDGAAPRSYSILVHDPSGRYGSAFVEDVESTRGEIVIPVGKPEWFELRAEDRDGNPVEAFRAALVAGSSVQSWEFDSGEGGHERTCRLRRPAMPCSVRVEAPGYRAVFLDTLPLSAFERPVVATLETAPSLRGVVHHGGEPVAGASVEICPVLPAGRLIEVNGFLSELDRTGKQTLTTDSRGRFVFSYEVEGLYDVWAESESMASAATRVDLLGQDRECDLELGPGGVIDGEVLVPRGRDPRSFRIGYHRGGGRARTVRPDREGRFRLENLAQGPWELRPVEEALHRGDQWINPARGREIEYNCRVTTDTVTRFVLDLRLEEQCEVQGKLLVDGAAASAGWRVSLHEWSESGSVSLRRSDPSAILSGGEFRMATREPGRYWLSFLGSAGVVFKESVDLDVGTATWSTDLASAAVHCVIASRQDGPMMLRVRVPSGGVASVRLDPRDDGSFVVPRFFAGRGTVEVARHGQPARVLAEFEIRPGEKTWVEVR